MPPRKTASPTARSGADTPTVRPIRPQRSARESEVVDAAVRVIAREGLSGTSLRAIAREIGYTTGIVMHYFQDKQELLVAAADAVFGPFDEALAEALRMEDSFEGLRRICLVPLPVTRATQVIPRIYAQVVANAESEPAFARAFQVRYDAIRDGIRTLLANGQRNGSFRTDFDPVARCDVLCALVDGLAMHAITDPERFPRDRLVELLTPQLEQLRPAN